MMLIYKKFILFNKKTISKLNRLYLKQRINNNTTNYRIKIKNYKIHKNNLNKKKQSINHRKLKTIQIKILFNKFNKKISYNSNLSLKKNSTQRKKI